MKILVTGANGQLGSEIKQLAGSRKGDQFTFVDIEEMDLGKDEAIRFYFKNHTFDLVVNCAAYTAVDRAEEVPEVAFDINANAVKSIATACRENKMQLIHVSTDYVFDGGGNKPISEQDKPNPLSVYGKSKLQGERFAQEILPNSYIVRTAWVYSSYGKNFVKTILKLAREKESLNVVSDQIGSPTYARDLAAAILSMADKIMSKEVDAPGVYHYSNEGVISWYDFAVFIGKHFDLPCRIRPIPSEDYKTLAVRPAFSALDKRLIKTTFRLEVPHWHKSLTECLSHL